MKVIPEMHLDIYVFVVLFIHYHMTVTVVMATHNLAKKTKLYCKLD